MHRLRRGNVINSFHKAQPLGKLNINLQNSFNSMKRKGAMAIFFSIIAFLLMIEIALSAQQVVVSITTSGTIGTAIPGNLIFSSGFEDSRDRGTTGEGAYALTVYNQVTNARAYTYMYPNGNSWWINGRESAPSGAPTVTSHSGSYCLGMKRNGGNRAEFQLRDWKWNSYDEWYFSMWLYFPSNWDTTPPVTGSEVMFAFGDSIYHATGGSADGGMPYIDIALWAWSAYPTGTYTLVLEGRGFNNEGHTYDTQTYFALPRGQWSHWEIYFDRGDVDAHNGSVWVKVNGVEYLRSIGNIYGKWSGGYQPAGGKTLEIYPQDLYAGSGGTEYRYLDDLEIWSE
jgi:hypothetical protein